MNGTPNIILLCGKRRSGRSAMIRELLKRTRLSVSGYRTCTLNTRPDGYLDFVGGVVSFAEHEGRGNGNIASFARCELIGLIPGGSGPLKKGDVIQALRLPPELC